MSEQFQLRDELLEPERYQNMVRDGVEGWTDQEIDQRITDELNISKIMGGNYVTRELEPIAHDVANVIKPEIDALDKLDNAGNQTPYTVRQTHAGRVALSLDTQQVQRQKRAIEADLERNALEATTTVLRQGYKKAQS